MVTHQNAGDANRLFVTVEAAASLTLLMLGIQPTTCQPAAVESNKRAAALEPREEGVGRGPSKTKRESSDTITQNSPRMPDSTPCSIFHTQTLKCDVLWDIKIKNMCSLGENQFIQPASASCLSVKGVCAQCYSCT